VDDFAHRRSDVRLAELVGHELPSPEAARKFLNAFHEEEKIEEAQQRRLPDTGCGSDNEKYIGRWVWNKTERRP